MADKVYLKCSAKALTFKNGGQVVKIGIKATDLAEFIHTHQNQRGYVNLVLAERREAGQYGDTHYLYLDDWKPAPKTDTAPRDQRYKNDPKPASKWPKRPSITEEEEPF